MSGSAPLVPCLMLGLVLASCSREPDAPAAPVSSAPAPAASAPAAAPIPPSEAVAAVAIGTATLPLALRFELPEAPVVGQPARLVLTITAAESLQRVQVTAKSLALSIDGSAGTQVVEALEPGQDQRVELRFTPTSAGLADMELEVQAQGEAEGEPLTSRYAIPVLSLETAPTQAPAGSPAPVPASGG
jgi:hypothetical protein